MSVLPDASVAGLSGDGSDVSPGVGVVPTEPQRPTMVRSGGRGADATKSALLDALRRDLADGRYSPRERLVEAELVVRYSAPRAAVREALIRLASEGLVEREPHRGARVRGMSIAEAIEIAEVRRALETIAAGHAARRATPAERRAILDLSQNMCDAARDGNVGEYLRLNARYHRSLIAMARDATVHAILAQFQQRPIDRFLPEPFRPIPPTASVEAHRRIAVAIGKAEPAAAESTMHEHLTDLVEVLRQFQASTVERPAR